MWKFVLIAYTRVDTDNATFSVEQVTKAAVLRLSTRIEAYIRDFRDMLQTHRSRGEEPPQHKIRNYQRYVEPYLRLHPTGRIEYAEPLRVALNTVRTYQIPGEGFPIRKEKDRQYPYTYPTQPPPNPWARVIYEGIIPAERKSLDATLEANVRSTQAATQAASTLVDALHAPPLPTRLDRPVALGSQPSRLVDHPGGGEAGGRPLLADSNLAAHPVLCPGGPGSGDPGRRTLRGAG